VQTGPAWYRHRVLPNGDAADQSGKALIDQPAAERVAVKRYTIVL
jgi:hypothetical protein